MEPAKKTQDEPIMSGATAATEKEKSDGSQEQAEADAMLGEQAE